MIRYLTAGESHGPQLTVIIEGVPAGLCVGVEDINAQLARRQGGYGRGGRMKIEKDKVEITSGLRWGVTLGSPITMIIKNRDWESWRDKMHPTNPYDGDEDEIAVTKPRPGHADLSGALKYHFDDVRNVLERSSARETAARTAAGALARVLIKELFSDFDIHSYVTTIGKVMFDAGELTFEQKVEFSNKSEVACPDEVTSEKMKAHIDKAKNDGDSLGGVIEIEAKGLPVGLGSHTHWDKRLDGLLAGSLVSIPAIKGVEIGAGFASAYYPGSLVHDEIMHDEAGFYRKSNNAGGIEGGMTNGENLFMRIAMKPIPTLYKPLQSVDLKTKEPFEASVERSDICAVPAAGVVAEAVVCLTLVNVILEKFGGDQIDEIRQNYQSYLKYVQER